MSSKKIPGFVLGANSQMDVVIRGGCLCKAIHYTILAPSKEELENKNPDTISENGKMQGNHCHCDACRKSSGALFQTFAQIPFKRINIVDGKRSLTSFRVSPNAKREHCAICGTSMWIKDEGWDDPEKGYINVSVGTMDKEDAKIWVHLRYHIFLGDTINGGVWDFQDSLPKFVLFQDSANYEIQHLVRRGRMEKNLMGIQVTAL